MKKSSAKSLRCSSKRLKIPSPSSFLWETSDSFNDDCHKFFTFIQKKPSPGIRKNKIDASIGFGPEDKQLFWSLSEKIRFMAFKDHLFAHGRVIYLEQLKFSHFS
ncbi:hypothetical protein HAX54_031345, partial [Datura stramonium]|nr:hypothetical protein [Datura stramonium]